MPPCEFQLRQTVTRQRVDHERYTGSHNSNKKRIQGVSEEISIPKRLDIIGQREMPGDQSDREFKELFTRLERRKDDPKNGKQEEGGQTECQHDDDGFVGFALSHLTPALPC